MKQGLGAVAPSEEKQNVHDTKDNSEILQTEEDTTEAANDANAGSGEPNLNDAANDPNAGEPKKSWSRYFGGTVYNEIKNALGWFGTLSALSATFYVFSKIALPVSITAVQAFNPALIIPGELVKMFFATDTLIDITVVLDQAIDSTNKSIPDSGFKAGKEWAKDALRKRFGINKESIDPKNEPTGFFARRLNSTLYFQIADKTSDVLALGYGFLHTIKTVGVMYFIVGVASRIVTGNSIFALPAASFVIDKIKQIAMFSAGIAISKQAVPQIGKYGYDLVTGTTDAVYNGVAGAYDYAANSAPATYIYDKLPNNPVTFMRNLYNGPAKSGSPITQDDTIKPNPPSFGSKIYNALWF